MLQGEYKGNFQESCLFVGVYVVLVAEELAIKEPVRTVIYGDS